MRKLKITYILALALFSSLAKAQVDTLNRPYLNRHRFALNELIPNPFIYTGFTLNMGYGESESYDFPTFSIGDREVTIKAGGLLFANLNAGYAQQINDWSMAFVNFGFVGRLGTEPASVLSQGLNSLSGLRYGMRFKLQQSSNSMLSGELQMRNQSVSRVNVYKYVKDLIENNPAADLSETVSLLAGSIGLHYAYAYNELIGLQANIRYMLGDHVIENTEVNTLNFSFAIDFNLRARTRIPLSINAGVSSSTVPEFTLDRSKRTFISTLQLTYMGRDDLQVGINSNFFRSPIGIDELPITQDLESNVNNLSLVMRYFF